MPGSSVISALASLASCANHGPSSARIHVHVVIVAAIVAGAWFFVAVSSRPHGTVASFIRRAVVAIGVGMSVPGGYWLLHPQNPLTFPTRSTLAWGLSDFYPAVFFALAVILSPVAFHVFASMREALLEKR